MGSLSEGMPLRTDGILVELPDALNLEDFNDRLLKLEEQLKQLSTGRDTASEFEDIVGEILRLCFFKVLANIQPQERDTYGVIRRDWVASVRAERGFWANMRQRYKATQVIFECKNYEQLDAGDFQQVAYYLTDAIGGLAFIAYRGAEESAQYMKHIKRVASDKGGDRIILLLNQKDLFVFLRQARHGKEKDSHLQEIYDRTVRAVS